MKKVSIVLMMLVFAFGMLIGMYIQPNNATADTYNSISTDSVQTTKENSVVDTIYVDTVTVKNVTNRSSVDLNKELKSPDSNTFKFKTVKLYGKSISNDVIIKKQIHKYRVSPLVPLNSKLYKYTDVRIRSDTSYILNSKGLILTNYIKLSLNNNNSMDTVDTVYKDKLSLTGSIKPRSRSPGLLRNIFTFIRFNISKI